MEKAEDSDEEAKKIVLSLFLGVFLDFVFVFWGFWIFVFTIQSSSR
jgi:hypothetical protein